MSDRSEFLEYLEKRVQHYVDMFAVSKGKAFTIWYGVDNLGLDEDTAYEASQADGGMDKGMDFFFIDDEHQRVIVLGGKYRKKGDYKPKTGEVYEVLHAEDWLNDPEALRQDGREDLASSAEDFQVAVDAGYTTELTFVYSGPAKQDVQDVAEKFNQKQPAAGTGHVCRVISLDTLVALHRERVTATRVPDATIKLKKPEWFVSKGSFGQSLVGTVPGAELKRLYETYGESLFDRNIRLFLGARKGGVNAGIRDTLDSPKQRKNFWAYNNGITLVCDTYALDESSAELKLTNFSIVNGCQTTTSLGRASATAAGDADVIVRVIQAVDPVIDEVIRFNNSQTPIRIWEFSSQDPLQREIKSRLAEGPQPYFYDIRKGEARSLSKEEQNKFRWGGGFQQIQHDLLTQYIASFDGMPTVAYKDKARLFESLRAQIYPNDIPVEKIILVWRLGQIAEEIVRDEIRKCADAGDEDALRILRRGAKMFVVAVAGKLLRLRNGDVFIKGLKREVASSNRTEERLQKYARLALTWYMQSVRDQMATGSELSAIVKSEELFQQVAQRIQTSWDTFALSDSWKKDALPAF